MRELLVSVLILNYNGIDHLEECFNSLSQLTYKNVEIILIDNNSQDNSVNFIRENYPNVNIIKLNKNFGFTGGNNAGASQAKGEYIVLLNNDTIVDKNWLTELVRVAQKSKNIGVVGSKIYNYYNREFIDYAGSCCDKYLRTDHIGRNLNDNKFLDFENETFYACGAALLIKRELYKKIGLFDPLYFIYCEDFDLSWRTWLAGYKVMYAPKSFLFHKIGQVLEDLSPRKFFLHERNRLRTLLKNYELKSILKILPLYLVKRIGMFVKLCIQFDNTALLYLYINIKSLLWNIIHMKSLIRNRRFIKTIRIKDDKFIFEIMNKTVKFKQAILKIKEI
ncbi:MAG: glycosyltransferase family 2 protein [Promethearchaeota archaeon]